MTEFKNTEQQLSRFRLRVAGAALFVMLCFGLLGFRFLYLQVWHYSEYSLQADENRISVAPILPNRGVITDRNGIVLARNYSAYTLEITPSKLDEPLDQVITELGQVIPVDERDRRRFKKLLEDSKHFESLPIRSRLSDDEVARFTAQRYRFPGVDVRARLFRSYPLGTVFAHAIGYIGRISERDRANIEAASEQNDNDSDHYDPRLDANNYKGTDYIGKIGVEQSYETELHGLTGSEEVEVTAGGRPVRTMSRTQATPGNNLRLSLDVGLQETAERAFAGRKGALVAIEPATGQVLAFVSAPSFDPNIFVDGVDQQTWDDLNNSPDKPLLNRPLRGTYPPGSTYKPFVALAALTLHKRTPEWGFQDTGSYTFAGHVFHNDVRSGQGWIDMNRAITVSNDTYFYMLAHDLGVNAMAAFMKPLGFGQITGIDIDGEAKGILPSTDWKKHAYRRPEMQRWYEGETISLGIGQGYNSFTMLQLAHATATLANDGVVMTPHLVQEIEDPLSHQIRTIDSQSTGKLDVRQQDIDFIKHAMENVLTNGTGAAPFRGIAYEAAGKTGTAQVYSLQGERYHASAVAENRRDHALFTAFAPVDKPQIAIALIVENGGWGAEAAGPVARKVLDYWLVDRFKPGMAAAAVADAVADSNGSGTVDTAPVIGGADQSPLAAALPPSVAAALPGGSSATAAAIASVTSQTPPALIASAASVANAATAASGASSTGGAAGRGTGGASGMNSTSSTSGASGTKGKSGSNPTGRPDAPNPKRPDDGSSGGTPLAPAPRVPVSPTDADVPAEDHSVNLNGVDTGGNTPAPHASPNGDD
ncbi:penicillin-binding protein 2 [Pararobbsia alpina]|uniref:Peptidoglycan D,D-transpeptidase MrdA n=1 Tax=Pararobbsia alpina TaxID=621374 RepID=A0A6S7C1T0_9BURK|nr:penicillin-binding protein 2 [Pararobbsia alpina]CAB3779031.1 Peptidoglycan D,D-transpeptidase MrdA [Pararobbsia alpina]